MGALLSLSQPAEPKYLNTADVSVQRRPSVNETPRKRRRTVAQYQKMEAEGKTPIIPIAAHHVLASKPVEGARKVARDKSTRTGKDDRDGESDCEEDIRGAVAEDAPVKEEHKLRAVRLEDGSLTLDTGGKVLYSEGFFDRMAEQQRMTDGLKETRCARLEGRNGEQMNFLDFGLRKNLRKRQVTFERSKEIIGAWNDDKFLSGQLEGAIDCGEKRRIDMKGKVYVAPLTTVGNLPFRRVCKGLGADVTCGEMAVAGNLLQGQNSEWALLRRHRSEDIFGVQLAGSNVETVTRAAELIGKECSVDFIELNGGCPIDLVFNRGGGCALMQRRQKLRRMVWSVGQVVDMPVGIKVRTGVSEGKRNAHEIIADVAQAGAGWVTVHGRSRKQRYSKAADWRYVVGECGAAARQAGIPLLGNGDVYNWRDVERYVEGGADSVMVARGALIKPWVLTEIKDRRDWDIRSCERLELYKEFVRHGLEHWGADARGVETTRKFLLEWLSFLYRYIPVGLLEGGAVVGMSHRAPFFRGRDELETLLGSGQSADWIRITEMLLGKVPDGFSFRARHKSNAWEAGSTPGAGANGARSA